MIVLQDSNTCTMADWQACLVLFILIHVKHTQYLSVQAAALTCNTINASTNSVNELEITQCY
jgi:hypothetical protein